MKSRASGRIQEATRSSSFGQLRMCSNISTDTIAIEASGRGRTRSCPTVTTVTFDEAALPRRASR